MADGCAKRCKLLLGIVSHLPLVSGLFVYPVKSLRGVALERSAVGARGLRYDRNWMIVDENGRFRTQRQIAKMARISTAIDEGLILSAEGSGSIVAPLEARGETIEATIWNWTGPARLVDPEVDRWLSEVLEMPCRLVAALPGTNRMGWGDGPIAFPDGAATLFAGEASLASLNAMLDEPVPIDRFRANVILSGSEPYAEDEWPGVRVGDVGFTFAKRCGRCLVTTTDQKTGERHPDEEPLRTLARERLFGKSACFGAYYVPENEGEIQVGDSIKV